MAWLSLIKSVPKVLKSRFPSRPEQASTRRSAKLLRANPHRRGNFVTVSRTCFPQGPYRRCSWCAFLKFTWNRTDSPPEILSRLRQLSEVSAEIRKLGLKEAPIEGGAAAICVPGACQPKPTSEVPKVIENVTLLTALNRIVHSRDGAVWIYSEYRWREYSILIELIGRMKRGEAALQHAAQLVALLKVRDYLVN